MSEPLNPERKFIDLEAEVERLKNVVSILESHAEETGRAYSEQRDELIGWRQEAQRGFALRKAIIERANLLGQYPISLNITLIDELNGLLRESAKDQSEGAARIVIERSRQKTDEGYTPEHDSDHHRGELALAAIAYAAPDRAFILKKCPDGYSFRDPWPFEDGTDKRFYLASENGGSSGNVVPSSFSFTYKQRVYLLVKAGALIAAEIDRLLEIIGEPKVTPE